MRVASHVLHRGWAVTSTSGRLSPDWVLFLKMHFFQPPDKTVKIKKTVKLFWSTCSCLCRVSGDVKRQAKREVVYITAKHKDTLANQKPEGKQKCLSIYWFCVDSAQHWRELWAWSSQVSTQFCGGKRQIKPVAIHYKSQDFIPRSKTLWHIWWINCNLVCCAGI